MMNNTDTESAMLVARDAAAEGRTAEAIKLMVCEGGMTLSRALDETLPAATPRVGDILSCGWGYEQTRYDFYQVVGVTKASVKIRKIAKSYVTRGPHHGSATVVPVPGSFASDKVWTKRFRAEKTSYSCNISDHSSASLWDGKPEHESGDH